MHVLVVDNKDSFTFNLSQLVAKVTGCAPIVISNCERSWRDIAARHGIRAIVISPGPGTPDRNADFGICLEIVRETGLPLLGVCLGHEGIGHAYGAKVVRAPLPMHGRISRIIHDGSDLFTGIPDSLEVVRYHSLCLDRDTLPACLQVTASTSDGIVMALRHTDRPQFGVQFHPESVCAEFGERLVRNFLEHVPVHAKPKGASPGLVPRPGSKRPERLKPDPQRSRVVVRKLNRWVDTRQAFESLFVHSEHAFWLDSAAVVPGYSRFSVMGDVSGPDCAVLRYKTHSRRLEIRQGGKSRTADVDSLLPELRKRLAMRVDVDEALPFDFQTGLVGYFGFDLRNELGAPTERTSRLPDAALLEVDRCMVFDHENRHVFLVMRTSEPAVVAEGWFNRVESALRAAHTLRAGPHAGGGPIVASLADGPDQYLRKIRECQNELAAGESYQICLSSEFAVTCSASPYDTYRALRAINPAPYAAYLRFGDFAVLSSSPERFLQVGADRTISAKPIKGTCARADDPVGDAKLAQWLRSDEKSRSENLMIVDLLRNDIGRVADTATVQVPRLMEVESYATVHQLVSTVTGRLREDRDCLDCLAAAFPGGSMTGAPKLRTMSIIDRLEARARGVYSGAIGFLSYNDRMDLSIVIRTIVMAGSLVTVASGGGIVAMSNPRDEFEEMVLKARAPLRALASASAGDADALTIRFATP